MFSWGPVLGLRSVDVRPKTGELIHQRGCSISSVTEFDSSFFSVIAIVRIGKNAEYCNGVLILDSVPKFTLGKLHQAETSNDRLRNASQKLSH
jgi:hypothetical protein